MSAFVITGRARIAGARTDLGLGLHLLYVTQIVVSDEGGIGKDKV
jgi:hypothetical protein